MVLVLMTLIVQCKSCVDQIQHIARYFKLFTHFLLILGKSCIARCYSHNKTEKESFTKWILILATWVLIISLTVFFSITYKRYFDVKFYEGYRSSCSQMVFKVGVLKGFAIFRGKHLSWSLFLVRFMKKRPQPLCFPVNIAKIFRTTFFIERLWWLLLKVIAEYASKDLALYEKNKF